MATEAQRLIGISLAKIAQSRCGRGGCSLHKNLLVATVLQKARYIFMEEAFHMVHGHYINQQNSKLIEQQQQLLMQHHHQKMLQMQRQEELEHELRQHEKATTFVNDNDSSLDDSELDIFSSSSIETNDGLEFLNHTQTTTQTQVAIGDNDDSSNKEAPGHSKYFVNNKENNPPSASTSTSSLSSTSATSLSSATTTELVYLDMDVVKSSSAVDVDQHHVDVDCNSGRSSTSISGNKRPLDVSEWETEEAILSILPKAKQIKYSDSEPSDEDDDETSNSDLTLDFLSNDLHLTNKSPTKTNMTAMTPLDMSSSSSSNNNNINNSNTSASQSTPPPSSSSIERITSLVSIFNMSNFGNLQRSVSNPDLCSSSSHSADGNCCLTTQRQYLAMAV
ncbi:unnamed protein product [Diamesa serratosioi]